ncbi:MAG TPA: hypothetical protein VJW23_07755, partial [Propionibacteriaceae bacterium]|nr:hypothetical protein [Propionibacteriaceae bacterium]
MVHLAREFAGAALQRSHEINRANGESRLRREGREDFHCAIAERIDLVSPYQEHPDNFVVEHHR